MKYIIRTQKTDIISLKDFIEIVEMANDLPKIRNKCLLKKDDRIFRLVLDCKDYSYKLLNLKDFSIVYGMSFSTGFTATIEELLTNGYEIIYED